MFNSEKGNVVTSSTDGLHETSDYSQPMAMHIAPLQSVSLPQGPSKSFSEIEQEQDQKDLIQGALSKVDLEYKNSLHNICTVLDKDKAQNETCSIKRILFKARIKQYQGQAGGRLTHCCNSKMEIHDISEKVDNQPVMLTFDWESEGKDRKGPIFQGCIDTGLTQSTDHNMEAGRKNFEKDWHSGSMYQDVLRDAQANGQETKKVKERSLAQKKASRNFVFYRNLFLHHHVDLILLSEITKMLNVIQHQTVFGVISKDRKILCRSLVEMILQKKENENPVRFRGSYGPLNTFFDLYISEPTCSKRSTCSHWKLMTHTQVNQLLNTELKHTERNISLHKSEEIFYHYQPSGLDMKKIEPCLGSRKETKQLRDEFTRDFQLAKYHEVMLRYNAISETCQSHSVEYLKVDIQEKMSVCLEKNLLTMAKEAVPLESAALLQKTVPVNANKPEATDCTSRGDKMRYVTRKQDIRNEEKKIRKSILMRNVQIFFASSRDQEKTELLSSNNRKNMLLQLTKRFFDDFNKTILFFLTHQIEQNFFHYNVCHEIQEQQMTVYMMPATYKFPREPQKPVSADINRLYNIGMSKEIVRYGTFEPWPKGAAGWPNRLAGAGFYYSGQGDEVTCYSCGVTQGGWRPGMVPLEVHRRLSPTCSFVTNQAANIPVIEDPQAKARLSLINGNQQALSMPTQTHQEVTERQQRSTSSLATSATPADSPGVPSVSVPHTQAQHGTATPSGQPFMSSQITIPITSSNGQQSTTPRETTQTPSQSAVTASRTVSDFSGTLGINTDRPQHPNYAVTASRMNTFNTGWPQSHNQTPRELAEAGFFYSGHGDSVRCFFCGTGLRNWDTGDNPWVEHARWSPQCVYLNQHQGPAFVTLVQDLSSGGNQVDYKQVLDILKDMPGTLTTHIHNQVAPVSSEGSTSDQNNISSCDAEGDKMETSVPDYQDDSLVEENELLKQQTVCKICLDKEVTIVFLPCGHLVCCAECAPALRKCPMCRADVKGTVRAYMG